MIGAIWLLCATALMNADLMAQSKSDSLVERGEAQRERTTIDFLLGYYEQDGVHSAVTGGEGTEKLEDRDLKVIINIPIDSIGKLILDADINYYTSASTDNIDTNVSSASREDLRSQFGFAYEWKTHPQKGSYSLGVGGSVESDYISTSFSGGRLLISKDGNQQFSLIAQAFFDRWIMIFPEELRNSGTLLPSTDKRNSYHLSMYYERNLSPRLKGALSTGISYQEGLLSTPFHRVYFAGQGTARVERLPGERWKFPFGLRAGYFMGDRLVIKTSHRYYVDSFGLRSYTGSFETRWKPNTFFTLYPFYRYYVQKASDYFRPIRAHELSSLYYTSDYDLSGFDSHKFGVGIFWTPLYGLSSFRLLSKTKFTQVQSLGLRYAYYQRGDGLNANQISMIARINID